MAAGMTAEILMSQPDLFTRAGSHTERAAAFHAENPHVFEALRRRALRAKRRGYKPGIKCLFELLRWSHGMSTQGDEFKLNNNYTAYYARLLMEREPELRGFFELREVVA